MTHYGPPSDGVTTPPRDGHSTENDYKPRPLPWLDRGWVFWIGFAAGWYAAVIAR